MAFPIYFYKDTIVRALETLKSHFKKSPNLRTKRRVIYLSYFCKQGKSNLHWVETYPKIR